MAANNNSNSKETMQIRNLSKTFMVTVNANLVKDLSNGKDNPFLRPIQDGEKAKIVVAAGSEWEVTRYYGTADQSTATWLWGMQTVEGEEVVRKFAAADVTRVAPIRASRAAGPAKNQTAAQKISDPAYTRLYNLCNQATKARAGEGTEPTLLAVAQAYLEAAIALSATVVDFAKAGDLDAVTEEMWHLYNSMTKTRDTFPGLICEDRRKNAEEISLFPPAGLDQDAQTALDAHMAAYTLPTPA